MKPTIDEAIKIYEEYIRRDYELPYVIKRYKLVIQALTEMKHRQNLYNTSDKPRTASDVTVYEVLNACDDVLFSRSELMRLTRDIVGQTKQEKPRTWREVTAGEVFDEAVKEINLYVSKTVQTWAARVIDDNNPDHLKHWKSMGA